MNCGGSMKRILLVDDEPAIIFAFSKVLKAKEVEIDTAGSAESAIDLLHRNRYDALVVDLRLTGVDDMDGLGVVSEANAIQNDCKIVVMTAYGGEDIRNQVFARGADYYMEKPVSASRIKETLADMCIYKV
ncbi:MAG: response regulator [Chitinivibrionales bacterium]|nr:response regulator [Chitinivibrionales bacterium]